jgi:hypothetical protein
MLLCRSTAGYFITGRWRWLYFTDEVHFRSQDLTTSHGYILREAGSTARLSTIQEQRRNPINVTVHVAAGISYNHKGPLIFYNDPTDPVPV